VTAIKFNGARYVDKRKLNRYQLLKRDDYIGDLCSMESEASKAVIELFMNSGGRKTDMKCVLFNFKTLIDRS
jgi:hypothetical protein